MIKKIVLLGALVLVVAAAIFAYRLRQQGFSARETPSMMEAAAARAARSFAVPPRYRGLKNPQAATPENLREGMEHFADHCAVCHANNGSGDTAYGRNMYPKAPDMRTEDTQKLSDGELYSIIQNGVRLTGMPAFGAAESTDLASNWNLVLFIRHLPRLTPEEEAAMKKLNPISADELKQNMEEEEFLQGTDKGRVPASKNNSHSKEH